MALRVYADTSVFGGCEDEEFREGSRRAMAAFREGREILVLSQMTLRELYRAPATVRAHLESIPRRWVSYAQPMRAIRLLSEANFRAGLVPPRQRADARHIAIATAHRVDLLLSWNFKHIVYPRRIRAYEAIHEVLGYPTPRILSPADREDAGTAPNS